MKVSTKQKFLKSLSKKMIYIEGITAESDSANSEDEDSELYTYDSYLRILDGKVFNIANADMSEEGQNTLDESVQFLAKNGFWKLEVVYQELE